MHVSSKASLANAQAAGAAGAGSNEEPYMDAQLEEDLVAMGIASPVTKATAGALYQQELSRQARLCEGLGFMVYLMAVGIASLVSNASAGALSQQELSRQARPGALRMRCRRHQGMCSGILLTRGPALANEMTSRCSYSASSICCWQLSVCERDTQQHEVLIGFLFVSLLCYSKAYS